MEKLYEQLKARMAFLESQEKSNEVFFRILELNLTMIYVQQKILEQLNEKK